MTGVLDLASLGGGYAETFLRSKVTGSVVETVVNQADWELDYTTIDYTKDHIFAIDFQSLKTGRIRYNMIRDGLSHQVTEVNNDNRYQTGYWQLANGGAYWRIYNTATKTIMEVGYGDESNAVGFRYIVPVNASATMKAICCTVKSEGGQSLREQDGLSRCIDLGVTVKTVSSTLIPIISIRPRATFNSLANLIIAIPKAFSIYTDQPIRLAVVHDVALTGASWVNVDTDESSMEYDITATAVSNGHVIYTDYTSAASRNVEGSTTGLMGKNVLWDRQDTSKTGILSICAVKTAASDADVLASLQWEEIR
jgi:hypothetical protein